MQWLWCYGKTAADHPQSTIQHRKKAYTECMLPVKPVALMSKAALFPNESLAVVVLI